MKQLAMMNWLLFYFTTKPPLAAVTKKRGSARALRPISPLRTAGRRCAPPPKKPPQGAEISEKISFWCDFTPKSEPFSAEAANLSRAACPPRRTRTHQPPPLPFFLISPAEFLFLAEKGLAGGCAHCRNSGGGAALVGKADALLAK